MYLSPIHTIKKWLQIPRLIQPLSQNQKMESVISGFLFLRDSKFGE